MFAAIWGSPMVADGKVYLGDEDGDVVILQPGKTLKVLGEMNMGSSVYSSPVAVERHALHQQPQPAVRARRQVGAANGASAFPRRAGTSVSGPLSFVGLAAVLADSRQAAVPGPRTSC